MKFKLALFIFKDILIRYYGYDKSNLDTATEWQLVSKAGKFLQDVKTPKRLRTVCAMLLASWNWKRKLRFLGDY